MGDCWESSLKMNFALQHVDGAQTIFVGDFPGIQKAWNTYYDQKGNDDKSSLVSSLVSGKLVVPEKLILGLRMLQGLTQPVRH